MSFFVRMSKRKPRDEREPRGDQTSVRDIIMQLHIMAMNPLSPRDFHMFVCLLSESENDVKKHISTSFPDLGRWRMDRSGISILYNRIQFSQAELMNRVVVSLDCEQPDASSLFFEWKLGHTYNAEIYPALPYELTPQRGVVDRAYYSRWYEYIRSLFPGLTQYMFVNDLCITWANFT